VGNGGGADPERLRNIIDISPNPMKKTTIAPITKYFHRLGGAGGGDSGDLVS